MTSIRRELLAWLFGGLVLAMVLAAAAVYRQAREEANALFDYHLQQMALSVPAQALADSGIPPRDDRVFEEGFVLQIWDHAGVQLYFSRPSSRLPPRAQLGFTTVHTDHGDWRVFSAETRTRVVQVAQPMDVRRALAAQLALRSVAPLALLLPLLGLLVWWTVGRGLAPLARVKSAVEARSPSALQPLPVEPLPEEARPLVVALNELLQRLDRALTSQRAFVADAAHELRTPLAALQVQMQLAERARSDEARAAAFGELRAGLKRATHLVEQLLTLARQEPEAAAGELAEVDLAALAERVVADQTPLAQAKGIDLGIAQADPATVRGDAEALRVMLGNLVDNAVRYTPSGGRVDVAVLASDGHRMLRVADTGPGIPPEDRARVFDRFYRREGTGVPGSGLGLAIVKNIAARHGAAVSLDDAATGGLVVTVRF